MPVSCSGGAVSRASSTTIEGRPIWVYKISSSPDEDNGHPEIFFNAYIHAREAITFEVAYDLASYLVSGYGSDPRATNIVDTRQIYIQPVVNPDGVEYNALTNPNGGGMWRKNRRDNGDGSFGIDLNRNFDFHWGTRGVQWEPRSQTYPGPSAASEPETQAVQNLLSSVFYDQREARAAGHHVQEQEVHPRVGTHRRQGGPEGLLRPSELHGRPEVHGVAHRHPLREDRLERAPGLRPQLGQREAAGGGELRIEGAANVAAGFLQGMPVGGSGGASSLPRRRQASA